MQQKLKIKPLSKEQLIISIDRLTRFKETETKYLRVFKEIVSGSLIYSRLRKNESDILDCNSLKNHAENIINYSLENLGFTLENDYSINKKLYDYENSVFHLSENAKILLDTRINFKAFIGLINENNVINLRWLKSLGNDKPVKNLLFPVKKVLLCEGITEEILLPVFARLCGYDFNMNGIYVISAGGKNQVVKYFYRYAETLKIPVFILLDKDAQDNFREIKPKLRKDDAIHILKCGEFEDLLPDKLIIKTLNFAIKNISILPVNEIKQTTSKVEFLEEFFKHRGMHEFKKSEFAQLVKNNISSNEDVSGEIREIISELQNSNKKGTKVPLQNGV